MGPAMKGINLIGENLEKICDVWRRCGDDLEMIFELEVNPCMSSQLNVTWQDAEMLSLIE